MAGGAAGYYLGHKKRHGLLGAVGGAILGHFIQEKGMNGRGIPPPTSAAEGGEEYYEYDGPEQGSQYGSDRSAGRRSKHHRLHGGRQ